MRQTHRPKLGQHFLRDRRFQRRIVDILAIRPDDLVCEIGPGRGAMTEMIAAQARQLIAIEIDPELARMLQEKLVNKKNIEVIEADILQTDVAELCRRHRQERCLVFGNLPYYITSPILHHLFDSADWVRKMGLLVQREVAERLTALPGSRDYGYLTVITQLYADPHIEFGVPPGAFSPPPKVDSAFVTFQIKPQEARPSADECKALLDFVKLCFALKRKNLLNNLDGRFTRQRVEQALNETGLPLTARAEELSLAQFEQLFRHLRA